jgi:uncharacterized membrane protein
LRKTSRFWEIDILRGIAVILMIFLHFLFDLNFLKIYTINVNSFPLILFTQPTRIIFVGLVGVSLAISYSRAKQNLTKRQIQKNFFIRGLKIFGLGLLISIVTWFYLHGRFVKFGILHCIGLSIIFAIPFLHLKTKNLLFGAVLIPIGILLRTMVFDFNWLFWLGFIPKYFRSVDYFPILPWFGVVLIGIFIGNTLYPEGRRIFEIQDLSCFRFIRFLCFLGQHSLVIYLLHQPILILLLYFIF